MFDRMIPFAVLVLRAWVGLNFVFAHGLGKISDPAAFLDGRGVQKFPLPVLFGWLAILSEFAGGILLTLGLWTRVAAAMILGTMVGAAFVVLGAEPWGRKELALTYAAVAFFFLIYGGGSLSVDRLLRKRGKR